MKATLLMTRKQAPARLLEVGRSASVGLVLALFGPPLDGHGQPMVQPLHSFGIVDGANPSFLVQGRDSALYGVAAGFPPTLFKLNTDGTSFAMFYNFGTNSPPNSALAQGTDGWLYGTTARGGSYSGGSVFKVSASGAGYTVLYSFNPFNEGSPTSGVFQGRDGWLYGLTGGAAANEGAVFRLSTNGAGYALLYSFTVPADGQQPIAMLQASNGTLYGMTLSGGTNGSGTVFALSTNGIGYSVLHNFDSSAKPSTITMGNDGMLYGTVYGYGDSGEIFRLNTDGTGYSVLRTFTGGSADEANPTAVVQGSDGVLYACTAVGGNNNAGGVIKLNTDGTGYAVLYSFTGYDGDGTGPSALMQGSDGSLYGATGSGGGGPNSGNGTVFKLNTDGTGYAVLFRFTAGGRDGANPSGQLVQAGGASLYGVASGGTNNEGMVFKLNADGTGFKAVYDFKGGADGSGPADGPVLGRDGVLYGVTSTGGINNTGTVFKLNPDGTGYAVLHSFGGPDDGAWPQAGLVQGTDGMLYGTTAQGGTNYQDSLEGGTVFKLSPDGTGYTVLYNFQGDLGGDGSFPLARLLQGRDGALYGTTYDGGFSRGTVFTLKTDGTGYAVLHAFAGGPRDGTNPNAGLLQGSDGALYGTTSQGGGGLGTVFKLNPDGSGYTLLHTFGISPGDGSFPQAGLVQGIDGALYGATSAGGSNGYGTVFKMNGDGTGYTVLYGFSGGADGANPRAGVVQGNDDAFYGTTFQGGDLSLGTIFRLGAVPAPRLASIISLPDNNVQVILSAAPYGTWRVQAATNLRSPVTWTTITNLAPTNGLAQFSDVAATNFSRRFYRALWP